ncbi:MAG TPA: hypothetical protein VL307_03225 [Chitinophagaceae bacterium]|nr:hypothetical protein [Chitinophagaceae bacterium]
MRLLSDFTLELKRFSRANWWIYIIYFLLLAAILMVEREKLLSVFMITSLHFVADIFIMMMFTAYANGNNQRGTYCQVMSMLLFMSLKIYTGMIDNSWHYLAADPLYILAAIKNYRKDVLQLSTHWISTTSMTLLALCIFSFLIYARFMWKSSILATPSQWVQTTGIFLFAIALSITVNEKKRAAVATIALLLMVVGSAWETYLSFKNRQIVGLALSYFLLPLTVLVFYASNISWRGFRKPSIQL